MQSKETKYNLIQDLSYKFALRAIKLARILQKERQEFILSKQFVRSATSIGANIEESIGSQTRADFLTKVSISYKECRECNYWLRLMHDSELISKIEFDSLYKDLLSIQNVLASIIKTTKEKK